MQQFRILQKTVPVKPRPRDDKQAWAKIAEPPFKRKSPPESVAPQPLLPPAQPLTGTFGTGPQEGQEGKI